MKNTSLLRSAVARYRNARWQANGVNMLHRLANLLSSVQCAICQKHGWACERVFIIPSHGRSFARLQQWKARKDQRKKDTQIREWMDRSNRSKCKSRNETQRKQPAAYLRVTQRKTLLALASSVRGKFGRGINWLRSTVGSIIRLWSFVPSQSCESSVSETEFCYFSFAFGAVCFLPTSIVLTTQHRQKVEDWTQLWRCVVDCAFEKFLRTFGLLWWCIVHNYEDIIWCEFSVQDKRTVCCCAKNPRSARSSWTFRDPELMFVNGVASLGK